MIHDNPLRGKQAETRKRNLEDMEIKQAELAKLNKRREEATTARNWAALRRLAFDYIAISKRQAIEINNALPAAYKIPPDVLLATMELQ